MTDRDALYAAYQFCAAEGGPGPGPDRVSYADLSPGEVGDLVAVLSDALTNRWYRADPDRFAGLGFVLGDGWCGVDLDDVRHPDGGVRAWAATLPTCRPLPPAGTLGPDRWFSRRTPRS